MKKKIIGVLILGLSLGFTGCADKTEDKTNVKDENLNQFEVLSNGNIGSFRGELIIVRHKETNKRFIIYIGDRKGGICPLD